MKDSTVQLGRAFENEIRSLLVLAGYRVECNVTIYGQEIDIVASKEDPLARSLNVAIECKFLTDTNRSVSNQDVFNFITAYDALSRKARFTHGLIVTNARFSQHALRAAESHEKISLRTQTELQDELFGIGAILRLWRERYNQRGISHAYLALEARDLQQQKSTKDIVGEICHRCVASPTRLFIVLGDFGRGKTTICERLVYEFANSYLQNGTGLFPVLLQLRYLRDAHTLNAFVLNEIEARLNAKISIDVFWQLHRDNRLILLLDGFDEIASHATEVERTQNILRLLPLLDSRNPTVLTSRPSHFRSLSELDAVLSSAFDDAAWRGAPEVKQSRRRDVYATDLRKRHAQLMKNRFIEEWKRRPFEEPGQIFELQPLSRDQVIQYLEKHADEIDNVYGVTPAELYKKISGVYDLSDLIRTPLLLDMILVVLLEEPIEIEDPNLTIGPAALYKNYVEMQLHRDWSKGPGRQFLTREERLMFARSMALIMLHKSALDVRYDEIVTCAKENGMLSKSFRKSLFDGQLEAVCADIQVCAFLTLKGTDLFEFVHKSFMEYFLADLIREQIALREDVPLLHEDLNAEVLYFLGSMCLFDRALPVELRHQMINFGARSGVRYRSNLIAAQLYAKDHLEEEVFARAELKRLKLRDKKLSHCQFHAFRFDYCTFDTFEFAWCRLNDLEFLRCSGHRIGFFNCDGRVRMESGVDALEVDGGALDIHLTEELGTIEIKRSKCRVLGNGSIKSGIISDSSVIFDARVCNNLVWQGIEFSGARMVVDFLTQGASSTLEDVDVLAERLRRAPAGLAFRGCKFRDCRFSWLPLDGTSLERVLASDAGDGVILVHSIPDSAKTLRRIFGLSISGSGGPEDLAVYRDYLLVPNEAVVLRTLLGIIRQKGACLTDAREILRTEGLVDAVRTELRAFKARRIDTPPRESS
jgi:hypothetical protein